jgi:hypothetical protein
MKIKPTGSAAPPDSQLICVNFLNGRPAEPLVGQAAGASTSRAFKVQCAYLGSENTVRGCGSNPAPSLDAIREASLIDLERKRRPTRICR